MAGEIDGIPWSSALVVLPARPYNSIKMSAGLPVSPGVVSFVARVGNNEWIDRKVRATAALLRRLL
jgi:hypothetical protein